MAIVMFSRGRAGCENLPFHLGVHLESSPDQLFQSSLIEAVTVTDAPVYPRFSSAIPGVL
jgi:hypothetical protein